MPAKSKITKTRAGGSTALKEEADRSNASAKPAETAILLDIDPRIDLTSPIYEQAQRLWAIDQMNESAATMMETIRPHLTDEDDAAIWQVVLRTVLMDIDTLDAATDLPEQRFIKIGLCSHWMRPHQSR